MTPTINRSSAFTRFVGGLAVIAVVMFALSAVDLFLARLERAEQREEGRRYYETGQSLLKQGAYDRAADQFRSASSVERSNREYRLAWAQALLADGKLNSAEEQASRLLEADSTDGDANLTMARIFAREGKPDEAISYYHRAIYGRWGSDAKQRRMDVRWELIDLLAGRKSAGDDMLAELLLLLGESNEDPTVKRKVAHFYVAGGAPDRAIPLFEDLIRLMPSDADAYAGLGEAQLNRGDYRRALASFQSALRLNPKDTRLKQELALTERVLTMDPMVRGIGSSRRTARTFDLLQSALTSAETCAAFHPNPSLEMALDDARTMIKNRTALERSEDGMDRVAAETEQLWKARSNACAQDETIEDRAISMVLRNASQ